MGEGEGVTSAPSFLFVITRGSLPLSRRVLLAVRERRFGAFVWAFRDAQMGLTVSRKDMFCQPIEYQSFVQRARLFVAKGYVRL